MELTTQQIAEKLNVDYLTASGLLRYLQQKGIVKKVGSVPAKSGKGKPSILFSLPDKVELNFAA